MDRTRAGTMRGGKSRRVRVFGRQQQRLSKVSVKEQRRDARQKTMQRRRLEAASLRHGKQTNAGTASTRQSANSNQEQQARERIGGQKCHSQREAARCQTATVTRGRSGIFPAFQKSFVRLLAVSISIPSFE